MRFIKKHRYTLIMLLAFILLVCLGLKMKEILVPDEGKGFYGKRTDAIGDHPISDDIYSKIDEEYAKDDNVGAITHRLQGKVIYYYITVGDKVSIKDAKAVGEKIATYFTEDQLSYYSIQVFVKKDDEKLNNFPIIGIKDPLSKVFSWSKDREIVESDKDED